VRFRFDNDDRMNYYRQGPGRPGSNMATFGVPGWTRYVKLIAITCGVVWLVQMVALWWFGVRLSPLFGVVPQRVVTGWLWQPLTYMFLHSPTQMFHILLNMLMLWMFGGELERYWGGRAFLRYYFVCGIGAGIVAVISGFVISGMASVPVIGASGAIFGVFIAYGMVFANRTVLFMMIFPMKARTMAWIMFAVTFFSVLTQSGSGISHVAHLGGAVVGYLYLKRAWRIGDFYRELRWKIRRRRFKVMPAKERDDFDRWVN
jgi:membrane associated rhomboid family serine protease